MKSAIIIIISLICFNGYSITNKEIEKIVDAIYIIEGKSAKYGIQIKTNNPRKICENTVRNNYKRWRAAESKEEFLEFLGDRYCPKSIDKIGNYNWKKNIKKLIPEAIL